MFDMKSKSLKSAPKYVLTVTTLVLLSACASKEITNASLEPVDLPADESSFTNATPEPETFTPAVSAAPATVKKSFRKGKKTGKHAKKKKTLAQHKTLKKTFENKIEQKAEPIAAAQVQKTEEAPPNIGEGMVASAPIAVPPMAPPVPFEDGLENQTQPNWWLAAFVVGGFVALVGLGMRMRRLKQGKRGLVYNA